MPFQQVPNQPQAGAPLQGKVESVNGGVITIGPLISASTTQVVLTKVRVAASTLFSRTSVASADFSDIKPGTVISISLEPSSLATSTGLVARKISILPPPTVPSLSR
ncbi:hypothetical protein KW797_01625 [Candidatus Parcubacteria bacterium]|nr:hypothetical protein [Candidatus Parcubacteria bacterium]